MDWEPYSIWEVSTETELRICLGFQLKVTQDRLTIQSGGQVNTVFNISGSRGLNGD